MKPSSYEGRQDQIRNLQTPEIEVWANQYNDRVYTISLEVPEFTCICPKTGLPDFAILYLDYVPQATCLELKSFKMYINFYRDIGIFHEHLVNKILDDIVNACQPKSATLKAVMNPRGGIKTIVEAHYPQIN